MHRFPCLPSKLIVLAIVLQVGVLPTGVLANDPIVLPNPEVFGKPIGKVSPLLKATANKAIIYPENIHLDLQGPTVYGLIAKYPESVSFKQLVAAVNEKHKKWTRDADGEMAKWGVTVWRNDEQRYSIQVAESQIIMIWLDREVTQKEVNALTEALMHSFMEQALAEQQKSDQDDAK